MHEPVAFISRFRIKEGKLDGYLDMQRANTARLEAEKDRTLVFLVFVNESQSEMTALHVFGDAESMDLHFEGAAERAGAAYEFIEPQGWEVYGTPSERALESLRRAAASFGTTLTLQPRFSAGFIRPTPPTPSSRS